MIEARHGAFAALVFKPWLRWMLRRHFHGIHLLGAPPGLDPELPLLLLPNHSSWWDGFFLYELNRSLLERDLRVMMLEEQLQKNRFFSRVGAYSITPGDRREVSRSLRYTLALLEEHPATAVCMFPQGELVPFDRRPLELHPGARWLTRRCPVPLQVATLAVRVEMLAEQLPQVFFQFGPLHRVPPEGALATDTIEGELARLLDDTRRRIVTGEEGSLLLAGRPSLNERFEGLRRSIGLPAGGSS